MDGIYTVANDRMLAFLETFLRSLRHFMPNIKVAIIPFDDQIRETKAVAYNYNATVLQPDPRWDKIGRRHYGEEEYRPTIPAFRYYRKLNAFNLSHENFAFLDVNCLILRDLVPLWKSCMSGSHDIVFAKRSAPSRTLRRKDVRSVLNSLCPNMDEGFNASFFMSRKGVVNTSTAELIGSNQSLRSLFGRAPEQAFLSWYIAVLGLHATTMVELDASHPSNFAGKRFTVERNADGTFSFTEGPSKGRPVYFLKWTGQDASTVQDAKNAELFNLFRQ